MKSTKSLKVTFPDGTEICYRSSIHTVIEVLKWMGEERFAEIPIKISGRPLVSRNSWSELKIKNYTCEFIPGWYYIKQADTAQRYLQLRSINESMNLNLKIDLGDFKTQENPKQGNGARPKSLLRVTMPDGDIIDYESYRDVFATAIDRMGARVISRKANFDLSQNQPLLTATDTDGKRLKIGEALYLAFPKTAKEAASILGLISKRLGQAEGMIIEVLPAKK